MWFVNNWATLARHLNKNVTNLNLNLPPFFTEILIKMRTFDKKNRCSLCCNNHEPSALASNIFISIHPKQELFLLLSGNPKSCMPGAFELIPVCFAVAASGKSL